MFTDERPRVVVESPLKGDYEFHRAYALACLNDSITRGEAPYASHMFYAQDGLLDDAVSKEREIGMLCGFAWGACAEFVAVYHDLGITDGMMKGIERYTGHGAGVHFRKLDDLAMEDLRERFPLKFGAAKGR